MLKKQAWPFYTASFLLPGFLLLLVYAQMGVYPFGARSLLITDMSQQYVDFYSYLYEVLHNGEPWFFSWRAGLGMNLTGIHSFYLASPFSFLIYFFNKSTITEGILLITLLKTACCGLAFSFYAKKILKLSGLMNICFSASYALMSYVVVYALNIMWLDGVILLPVVLFCIHFLFEKKRLLPLVAVYWVLFISQFYIAYMVGIFSFLYFLCLCWLKKGTWNLFFQFFLCVGLAAAMSAFLWLPAYLQLNAAYLGPEPKSPSSGNISAAPILGKALFGAYDSLTYDGMPNVYCGLLPLLLMPLYFFNRKIAVREKLAAAAVGFFLIVSMMVWGLNLFWHGGDQPTWFPYRFSFLLSFCCVFMAIRAYQNRGCQSKWAFCWSCLVLAAVMGIVSLFRYSWVTWEMIVISLVFLGLYTLFFTVGEFFPEIRRVLSVLAALTVSLELFLNAASLTAGLDQQFGYSDRASYTDHYGEKKELVSQTAQGDPSWYRLEDKTRRGANDALSLGYNGLAHYSTYTNQGMSLFLGTMGISSRVQNRFLRYYGSSNIMDSLLGVKYVIGHVPPHIGYEEAAGGGEGKKVYENPDALPAAYLVSDTFENFVPLAANAFENQNQLVNAMTGLEQEYFTPMEGAVMTTSAYAYATDFFSDGWCSVTRAEEEEACLTFTVVNDKPQEVYFQLVSSGISEYSAMYLNGEPMIDEKYPVTGMLDLGYFQAGDSISVQVFLSRDLTYVQRPLFYGFDEKAFQNAAGRLKEHGLTDIVQTGAGLSGTIDSPREALMFTSIPEDEGWSAQIDGIDAGLIRISDAFLAVRVPAGKHKVSFSFYPYGMRVGTAISIGGALLGGGVFLFLLLKKRNEKIKLRI